MVSSRIRSQMEVLGQYDDRPIFYFSGELAEICRDSQRFPIPYFVCSVFLHNNVWSNEDLREIIRFLMKKGAVFFLFHGNRCGDAHDLADEVQIEIIPEPGMTERNVIGTTWHEKDSEEDTIFATFCASVPASDYLSKFSSYLVVSVGTIDDNNRIRQYLDTLQVTLRRVLIEGEDRTR